MREIASGILNGCEDRPDKEEVASESRGVFNRRRTRRGLPVHVVGETRPPYLSEVMIYGISSVIRFPLSGRKPGALAGQIIQLDLLGVWELERKTAETGNLKSFAATFGYSRMNIYTR